MILSCATKETTQIYWFCSNHGRDTGLVSSRFPSLHAGNYFRQVNGRAASFWLVIHFGFPFFFWASTVKLSHPASNQMQQHFKGPDPSNAAFSSQFNLYTALNLQYELGFNLRLDKKQFMYQQEGIMKLDLVLHTAQTQHNDHIQQNTAATKCPNQLLAETKINKSWKKSYSSTSEVSQSQKERKQSTVLIETFLMEVKLRSALRCQRALWRRQHNTLHPCFTTALRSTENILQKHNGELMSPVALLLLLR